MDWKIFSVGVSFHHYFGNFDSNGSFESINSRFFRMMKLSGLFFVILCKENFMKTTWQQIIFIAALSLTACAPLRPASTTVEPPADITATAVLTAVEPVSATPSDQPTSGNQYQNDAFGLSFRFPAGWFGPEEYVSEQTLRVEIGSDKVYPYGTDRTEQIYNQKNVYNIVIQYSKGAQNPLEDETYQALAGMKDGESFSTARSMVIKVRDVELDGFKGYEYISTLSMTASTEPVYARQITLVDGQSNLLTILGNPNNVEVSPGEDWMEIYESIDAANQAAFHQIVESISVK
jgi:hypothetical protein